MRKLIERLDEILETSDIPWWEWNIKKNIVKFNALKVTSLGYTVEEFSNAKYQNFTALIHPDDYERSMEAMKDYLYRGAASYHTDYRIKDKSGGWHWYLDRGAAVEKDETGAPAVLRGIVLDMGYYFNRGSCEEKIIKFFRRSECFNDFLKDGIAVICSNCRKIKMSPDEWSRLSESFYDDAGLEISHSICPDCIKLLYPDLSEKVFSF